MIAKLICHAETREAAIQKMIRAIDEYDITGLETTLGFCRFVMEHDAFRSGDFDTRFVENHFRPELLHASDEKGEWISAALAVTLMNGNGSRTNASVQKVMPGKWKRRRSET